MYFLDTYEPIAIAIAMFKESVSYYIFIISLIMVRCDAISNLKVPF